MAGVLIFYPLISATCEFLTVIVRKTELAYAVMTDGHLEDGRFD
jgi:hypothetical protein